MEKVRESNDFGLVKSGPRKVDALIRSRNKEGNVKSERDKELGKTSIRVQPTEKK